MYCANVWRCPSKKMQDVITPILNEKYQSIGTYERSIIPIVIGRLFRDVVRVVIDDLNI